MKKYDSFHCYDKRLITNGEYTVQRGDTLYKIARNNGVAVEDLIAANDLTSNLIYPGQIIIIPKTVPSGSIYFEEYTIEADDTMESIAGKLNIRLDLLMKYNDITKLMLAENQVIRIPRPFETYVIQPDDTLESILRKFNMSLEELIRANINNWLQAGSTINVK